MAGPSDKRITEAGVGEFQPPGVSHHTVAKPMYLHVFAPQRANHVEVLLSKVRWGEGGAGRRNVRRDGCHGEERGGERHPVEWFQIPSWGSQILSTKIQIVAKGGGFQRELNGPLSVPVVTSSLSDARSFQRHPRYPGTPTGHGSTAGKLQKNTTRARSLWSVHLRYMRVLGITPLWGSRAAVGVCMRRMEAECALTFWTSTVKCLEVTRPDSPGRPKGFLL
eukprot:gene22414-biopygen19249